MVLYVRIPFNLDFYSCSLHASVTNYDNPAALAGV